MKPRWWLLYLTLPLMIGLFVLEGRLTEPDIVHRILELGIVIVCFGLMAVWVRANEDALIIEGFEHEHWTLEPDCKAEGELDPHRLPLAEDSEELEEGQYHLEADPSKGRFN
jgi:hypothetical protein